MIAALARPGDVVFSDELNHASIIDGCRLSRAEVFVYDHLDIEHLAWGIRQAEGRGALIATDSVFSMDGDVAPLEELVELARRHRIRMLVDEAHGTGALGPGGRGALAEAGLEEEVDVIVGTLGKALGSYGAFVACDREMADYLLNTARTFIFSTALPPPAAAGALAALELLESRPELVDAATGQRRGAARRARRRGLRRRRVPHADHAARGRRRRGHGRAVRAALERRRVRAGDPAADRPADDLSAAARGDGVPPGLGAARRGARAGRGCPRRGLRAGGAGRSGVRRRVRGRSRAPGSARAPCSTSSSPTASRPSRRRLGAWPRRSAACSYPAPTRVSARPWSWRRRSSRRFARGGPASAR